MRLSVANYETLVANAMRRSLRTGEHEVVPRISDLDSLVASTAGKVEIETVDDGRDSQVMDRIVKASILDVFRATVPAEKLGGLVGAFADGRIVHTGADVASSEYADLLTSMEGLPEALADLGVGETPGGVAAAVEFVLEGLHLSKRLNKDSIGGKTTYRSRG